MGAYELAVNNFAVAENLLQLYELFNNLREGPVTEDLRLAVCRLWDVPPNAALRNAYNEQMVMLAHANAPIPQALLIENGADFLLRQAVVVACTAVESFFWDSLRENALTIVRARRRGADETLRGITLTLDDYLSLENYAEPDKRLEQIILKNFERKTLYSTESIDNIAKILTVNNFWEDICKKCGQSINDIRRNLDEIIQRRNQIAHRADRPETETGLDERIDGHGLREITFPWVNTRVATAKSVVIAANECFKAAIGKLKKDLEKQEKQAAEQELAKATLKVRKIGQ